MANLKYNPQCLSEIAAEKIRRRWCNEEYFPSNEEIYSVLTFGLGKIFVQNFCIMAYINILVRSGFLNNEIKRLNERLERKLNKYNMYYKPYAPSAKLHEVTCAASLAYHGLLGPLNAQTWIYLRDVDLSSVPDEHLASLVSCGTKGVYIQNIRGCDLVTILDNVKSDRLGIYGLSLGSEETQALVRAMESRLERVHLGIWGSATLNTAALTTYSGKGKCIEWSCFHSWERYGRKLGTWGEKRRKGWKTYRSDGWNITFQRKFEIKERIIIGERLVFQAMCINAGLYEQAIMS